MFFLEFTFGILSKSTSLLADSLGINWVTKKEESLSQLDFGMGNLICGASGFGKTNLMFLLQAETLRRSTLATCAVGPYFGISFMVMC